MKKFLTAVITALEAVFLTVILLCAALVVRKVVVKDELPGIFGYYHAIVISGSMEPEISVGDIVIAKRSDSYQKDDIIMFAKGESAITHRIVGQNEDGFITKGDANNAEDNWTVAPDEIYGKIVLKIRGAGNVLMFFRTPLGILVLVTAGLAVIFFPERRKKDGDRD